MAEDPPRSHDPSSGDSAPGEDPGAEAKTEEERRRRALALSQEIARRYEPRRLIKVMVDGAGRGERLDPGLRAEMEGRLGGRFDQVRVYRGPVAEAVTRRHRADAVTVADTGMILVREGARSDPRSPAGKALLAHELTHVRQAQRGLHFALEGGEADGAPHEAEAAQVEADVLRAEEEAAARSGPLSEGQGASGAAAAEQRRQQVIERVFELLEEEARLQGDRLGRGRR